MFLVIVVRMLVDLKFLMNLVVELKILVNLLVKLKFLVNLLVELKFLMNLVVELNFLGSARRLEVSGESAGGGLLVELIVLVNLLVELMLLVNLLVKLMVLLKSPGGFACRHEVSGESTRRVDVLV